MTEPVLLDNDVVLKACCFGLGSEMISCISVNGTPPAILKVAEYVIRKRVRRHNRETAERLLCTLLSTIGRIEPDDEELGLAAAFEETAQAQNLELDSGESQLLAILLRRNHRLMITGDKRAIRAIEEIVGKELGSPRIACFEQLVTSILRRSDIVEVREKICRERSLDRAIAACFACSSPVVSISSVFDGLRSYIDDLRKDTQHVLLVSEDLSSFVP